MIKLIDFNSAPVNAVLNILLRDCTTGKNIIFATDAYDDIEFETHILPDMILGKNTVDVRPRVSKSMDEQIRRTRKKAEVFTPSQICNRMNNYCDEQWFWRKDVFNAEYEKDWIAKTEKIQMPNGKTWQDYVNSKRLEITCGEAPFIASRYDAATGQMIPIADRIGMLDRKLRIVNENVLTKKNWLSWVYRAYESVYGYEFQGDNLLIARVNLLETFCEYFRDKWGAEPTKTSVKRIADIISRNFWQMDGIHDGIPQRGAWFADDEFDSSQVTFFDIDSTLDVQRKQEKISETVYCTIHDWVENNDVVYKSLKEGKSMKFDFVIGNPPYQDDRKGDSATAQPVYHCFMESAYSIGKAVELITPARFLFNAGYTPKSWNKKMLSDEHLKVVEYENDAKKVFVNTDIKGGVAITYRDINKTFLPIDIFTMYEELNDILKKVQPYLSTSMSDLCFVASKFNMANIVLDYPQYVGHERRMSSNVLQFLTFHDKSKSGDIMIYGVVKGKRSKKYINEKYVDMTDDNIKKYKIITPKADGNGAFGSTLTNPEILMPNSGFTHTFMGIGGFSDLYGAEAAMKYIKTKFSRTMLSVLKITQDLNADKWKYVPLQDFTPSSDIDWSKSVEDIDRQLYRKYNLNDKETEFIEKNVKKMV